MPQCIVSGEKLTFMDTAHIFTIIAAPIATTVILALWLQ